jgi:hypothetical protein
MFLLQDALTARGSLMRLVGHSGLIHHLFTAMMASFVPGVRGSAARSPPLGQARVDHRPVTSASLPLILMILSRPVSLSGCW